MCILKMFLKSWKFHITTVCEVGHNECVWTVTRRGFSSYVLDWCCPTAGVPDYILRRAKYKLMTSSDTSEFAKTESYYYYIILTDRNENGFNHTSAYISLTLSRRLDIYIIFEITVYVLLVECE